MWKTVWGMTVPPKVKHFMWRFSRDSLATGDHVSTKGKRRGDACPFCNQRETQVHALCQCEWVSRLWRKSQVSSCFEMRGDLTSLEWVTKVAATVSTSEFEDWSMLLWVFWKERNAQMFNGTKLAEEEVVPRAAALLEEDRQKQCVFTPVQQSGIERHWTRPPPGKLKLNTDAGLCADGSGLGVVVRDENDRFLMAATKRIWGELNPEVGEALTAEFGLQLVRQHQVGVPQLEMDCASVLSCIRKADRNHTKLVVICRSIKSLLEEMGAGECKHAYRLANEGAHIMAHVDTRWNVAEVWFYRPPICLLDPLELDFVMASHSQ